MHTHSSSTTNIFCKTLPLFGDTCTDCFEELVMIWSPFLDNAMHAILSPVVIVSNGTVIVPLSSEIDGIEVNQCFQCVQTGKS